MIHKTEQRWLDGLGQRHTKDGRVRCQAVTKHYLRNVREQTGNPDLTSDDVWPEGQCKWSAEPGMYACQLHGGRSLSTRKPRVSDAMPLELREAMEVLIEDPDYISRADEINQIRARNVQLYMRLNEEIGGGQESWEEVLTALRLLLAGEVVEATDCLKKAVDFSRREQEIWDEIRENSLLIDRLTNTQVKSAKILQTMMTVEQVTGTVDRLLDSVVRNTELYIEDETTRKAFLSAIIRDYDQSTGASRQPLSARVENRS